MNNVNSLLQIIPLIDKIWLPLLNLIGQKNEFRVIVTSPLYVEIKILYGLVTIEQGEKKEFLLKGTDIYINSIVKTISNTGLDVKSFLKK
ncbi:MAG: hypothetical protein L3K52_07525 [Candidatus Thiothrix sulfatifontis]|nr:MAG: hypothetical protein L3K52_07525 [Candidatus Thiothrix sulfatifontis]